MSIKFLRISIFSLIFIIFLAFSGISFAKTDTFRSYLSQALRDYIELKFTNVMEDLENASLIARNLAPLVSSKLLFCNKIEMFGKYDVKEKAVFYPGESILVYFEPKNFSIKFVNNQYEINLKEYFRITDEKGKVITQISTPIEFHVKFFSPLTSCLYFRNSEFAPTDIGKYFFEVILEDLVKGKKLVAKIAFQVKKE